MIVVKFHPDAEAEMLAAAAYYETQQPNLGRRFLVAVPPIDLRQRRGFIPLLIWMCAVAW